MLEIKTQKEYDQWTPLVAKVLRGMGISVECKSINGLNYRQLEEVGKIGLVTAYRKYIKQKGPFISFAQIVIRNQINGALRYYRNKRNVSIEGLMEDIDKWAESNSYGSSMEILTDHSQKHPSEQMEDPTINSLISEALYLLQTHEREIIEEYYGLYGKTPKMDKEIALSRNCTRANIQIARTKALKKLRKNPHARRLFQQIRQ